MYECAITETCREFMLLHQDGNLVENSPAAHLHAHTGCNALCACRSAVSTVVTNASFPYPFINKKLCS